MILPPHARPSPLLTSVTAADLMTPSPVSIDHGATVPEAAAFLAGRGISAAPVIDDAGRPLGVVSSTDIVCYQSARARRLLPVLEPDERTTPAFSSREDLKTLVKGLVAGRTSVREIMTPTVFQVGPDAPAREVLETMVSRNIRRVYVVDGGGILVGVISATDILRKLGQTGSGPLQDSGDSEGVLAEGAAP